MDNKKNDVALVINGEFPLNEKIIEQIRNSNTIIAVDGASNSLIDIGVIPTITIGDFDSIKNSNKGKISKKIFTEDQNKTDLEKSLDWCIENNYKSLSVFGIAGKSEDHFLGNFFVMNDYYGKIDYKIITDFSIITPSSGQKTFKSYKGQIISLISFESDNVISSTNLKYPLRSYNLSSSVRAIRNESIESNFSVQSSKKLMVFQIKD
jgi:thiamine pyrophosphokinase